MDQQRQQIPETKRARFSLSQESITVLTVGVALAGLLLVNLAEMRAGGAVQGSWAQTARGSVTPIRLSRVTSPASASSVMPSVPAGRIGRIM